MEFGAKGEISRFDVHDVLKIGGIEYVLGKSSVSNLNFFLLLKKISCCNVRELDTKGVFLRRLGSLTGGDECDLFSCCEVLSSPTIT